MIGHGHPGQRVVQGFHDAVEHGAQAAGVQRLGHFVLLAQALDELVVELRRAVEVALEGGGGQFAAADGLDGFRGLGDLVLRRGELHPRRRDEPFQGDLVVVLQLLDVSAFLAGLEALGPAVIDEPDVLRALDHPVEVVGPYAVLVLVGGQAEAFAELGRDEGGAAAPARERAFVGREQDEVPEVQGAGFQRSHDLQPFQRFAPERDGLAGEEFVQQMQPGGGKDVQVDIG